MNTLLVNTPPRKQSGATLIVVMVILLVMTLLGLASTADSRLQLIMARNSQFQTAAHTAALSEINAQIDDINRTTGDVDDIIRNLLSATPSIDTNTNITSRQLRSGIDSDNAITRFLLGLLGSTASSTTPQPTLEPILGEDNKDHYDSSLIIREPDINVRLPVSGMSLGESGVKWRRMEFESMAQLKSIDFKSEQVQGFRYLAPN